MKINIEDRKSMSVKYTFIYRFNYYLFLYFSDLHEYDLIVIGGGSGGLACSKEGVKSFICTLIISHYLLSNLCKRVMLN